MTDKMYKMDFSKPPALQLSFSNNKEKNVQDMFLKVQDNYEECDGEIIGIFEGDKNPEKLYKIESCCKVPRKPNKIHFNGEIIDEQKVQIDEQMKEIEEQNHNNKNLAIAFFHNHTQGTNYSLKDIRAFLEYKYVYEMYLDTDHYVKYLIKTLDGNSNNQYNEESLYEFYCIHKETAKHYIDDLNDADEIIDDTERIEKRSEIVNKIFFEALDKARKENIYHFNVTNIRKFPINF